MAKGHGQMKPIKMEFPAASLTLEQQGSEKERKKTKTKNNQVIRNNDAVGDGGS